MLVYGEDPGRYGAGVVVRCPVQEEHATLSFIRILAISLGVLLIAAGLYTQKYATALIGLVVVVLNLRRARRGSRPRAAENDETPS